LSKRAQSLSKLNDVTAVPRSAPVKLASAIFRPD
jgi:hypothetical protein